MQWIMSKKLCEAPRKMSIRDTSQLPRRSANLWSGMVNPRLCEGESVRETSIYNGISKRRYGMQMEGNSTATPRRVKSSVLLYECLWLFGYKPSTSIEGARSAKIGDQIHKVTYPVTGCSGDLNLTVTVHHVNVGTSCFGLRAGLAAVDVKHEGRESRSSQGCGKHTTRRRTQASCEVPMEIGNEVGEIAPIKVASLADGIRHHG
jgi:hypothetical protein